MRRGSIQKKNYMRQTTRGMLCLMLSCAMALELAGCGGSGGEQAPELLEPISTNEAYRPATYGDIGKVVIKTGTVVPTDYCYYYDSSVTLSKVYVSAGDYVKSGTVLAEAKTDSEGASDAGTDLDGASEYTHNINEKIYEEQQDELDWKIKASDESGDTETADELRRQKLINAENNRYENVLYEYEKKRADAEKKSEEEKKSGGTLKADKDGYVTYAKLLDGVGNSVAGGQNVVVVSDYDSPYIEITGDEFKRSSYEIYNTMYAVVDGRKYDLEIYDYTNKEIALAQSSSSLPYIRFKLKDVENQSDVLKVGNSVSLYFSTSEATNVLVVGNDSIYEENGQKFVYVKTDESDKVRRDIETGKSDVNYTEVVSGLSQGELVYYASDAVMPAQYTEYTVSLGSYTKNNEENSEISVVDLNSISYQAPCSGRFSSLNVKEGQEVKKGDVLFVINSGGGSAELKGINNQIESENASYSESVKEYDSQIEELTAQIAAYESGSVATSTDVPNILYMAEQLTCQRNVVTYNRELAKYTHEQTINSLTQQRDSLSENNDGSGNISVYAEQDGTVLSVSSADYAVKEGDVVLTVGGGSSRVVAIKASDSGLPTGRQITFSSNKNENDKITGTCVGNSGDSARSYVFTDKDGDPKVTKSSSDELLYYVALDDETKYDEANGYKVKLPSKTYDNVVIIPSNMIYHETNLTNMGEYDYVWLITDGQIIKQYVTLGDSAQSKTVVLSGLSEGDVIAKETGQQSGASGSSVSQ